MSWSFLKTSNFFIQLELRDNEYSPVSNPPNSPSTTQDIFETHVGIQ